MALSTLEQSTQGATEVFELELIDAPDGEAPAEDLGGVAAGAADVSGPPCVGEGERGPAGGLESAEANSSEVSEWA